jgi:hypothetical protein
LDRKPWIDEIRHTHTTHLLDAGVPVHIVQARLGHEDPQTTLRSTRASPKPPTRQLLTRSARSIWLRCYALDVERDHLPNSVKLEVRQRCGFGCVMCGSPIFDYEHIEGYGNTGHDPNHMTLLCPGHHREKTAGRLPVALVRKWNKEPFNQNRDLTSRHPLYFDGRSLTVELGSVEFIGTDATRRLSVIEIDGESVISADFVEGNLILGMLIRDADNRPLLVVRKGELMHSAADWDVTYEGTTLKIRRGPRDVVLSIKLLAPDRIVVERAEIWSQGIFLRVGSACLDGDGIEVANVNSGFHGGTYMDYTTLLSAGDYLGTEGAALTIPVSKRWLGGVPAAKGSFSKDGGGQRVPFTDPPALRGR